jgi:hypothetical protein
VEGGRESGEGGRESGEGGRESGREVERVDFPPVKPSPAGPRS